MADLLNIIPWIVILIIYLGQLWQQWLLSRTVDRALERAQAPAVPTPVVVQHIPIVVPAAPPPLAKPTGAFADAPVWFQAALHEIGFHETGNNQGIDRYIAMAHCGAPGDPWCAIFANAMLESSGVAGTRSASSQSFRSHAGFVQLAGPALGALVVFWRGAPESGLGHVGFYRGEDADRVWTLGGNENDMVQIEALPKSSATFGLIGYWWPKAVPLPTGGAVMMPTGSPVQVQTPPAGMPAPTASTPAKQTNITATYFAGPTSAYGGPIDDNKPGVALPYHFPDVRQKVRVTGKRSGVSIDCDIVDVGPWNTNDPYWKTGARPQAETGTDSHGRHTNGAGIDLTLATAKALAIDGKGLVDWTFIEPTPQPATVV